MVDDLNNLVSDYASWLKNRTVVRTIGSGWAEIETPFLDRHNDRIQIYVKKEGNNLLLTDDGWTIADLLHSGCSLDSPKRKTLLDLSVSGFGVKVAENRIETCATKENFPAKKHNLIQAILAVNDLFYLSTPHVESLFVEDVSRWFDANDIRYTSKIKITGKSGFDHRFDFVIPKSKTNPERLIVTLNNPSRSYAESTAFKWVDTHGAREVDSVAYAMLNDAERQIPDSVVEAFKNYGIVPVLWSEKEARRAELAA